MTLTRLEATGPFGAGLSATGASATSNKPKGWGLPKSLPLERIGHKVVTGCRGSTPKATSPATATTARPAIQLAQDVAVAAVNANSQEVKEGARPTRPRSIPPALTVSP